MANETEVKDTPEGTETSEQKKTPEQKKEKPVKKAKTFDNGRKKKRKWIVRLVIIAVIALLIALWVRNVKKRAEEALAALASVETQAVSVRDLLRSIPATGTVVSLESKEVPGTLTGTQIASLEVEVGDRVREGDLLFSYDTTQIMKNLIRAQESLTTAQTRNALTESDLARSVTDAGRNRDYAVDAAQETIARLLQSADQARKAYEDHIALRDHKNNLQYNYESLLAQYKALTGTEDTDLSGNDLSPEAARLLPAIAQARTAASSAAATYQADGGDAATTSLMNAYNQSMYSYQDALKSYQNTVDSQNSAVAGARSSRSSAELGLNTAAEEDLVESYEQQMEKAQVTAPISGIVTAVLYHAGDTYAQGPVLTIQDDSDYEIETQISEYDISDVAEGQKVLIKTPATGDEELPGHIVKIAPVATAGSGGVTYTVRVAMDEPCDRLRLDMSASLSILIEEHPGALTVPYNAVQEDENGQTFVEVKKGEDEFVRVDVEVLLESNYYTEIAPGPVKEGEEVKLISNTEINSLLDELMLF